MKSTTINHLTAIPTSKYSHGENTLKLCTQINLTRKEIILRGNNICSYKVEHFSMHILTEKNLRNNKIDAD